jgi:predicted MFS family arabinose efflux permease
VLLGVHSALLEGSQRAYVADLVPADRRASAYGLYYTVVGLALLPASAVAGWLWERAGPQFTFALEAGLAALAALWFALARPSGPGDEESRAQAA